MLVPFLMTSAHENHLFLGSVLVLLIGASESRASFHFSLQILLLVQFVNLYVLYGSPPARVAAWIGPLHSDSAAVVYALVAVACFVIIAREFWSLRAAIGAPAAECSEERVNC